MTFAALNHYWAIILALVVWAGVARWKNARARKLNLLVGAELRDTALLFCGHRERWEVFWRGGVVAILVLLALSVLRPQHGLEERETKRKGVDLVIAVDVSESMLAQDVSPSRLERARREILDLLGQIRGDRVGLVVFAGAAFVEVPLTHDYDTVKLFLDMLDPELAPVPGTNIEKALRVSLKALSDGGKQSNETRGRAVLLISDGEELQGSLENIKSNAKELGAKIFVMGIGAPGGAPIPTRNGFKKDAEGKAVVTRMNPQLLAKAAEESGGVYVASISSDRDTTAIYEQGIKHLVMENEAMSTSYKAARELYQYPLGIALLLLLSLFALSGWRYVWG